ncbi:MAG TPA: LpqB family beta-propeller domain-containing protein [Vicinamibacterales bacterium]|nr:LpqB family beta-propeller domain-containing protein [Vicinamibacterales bacterium]
MTPARTASAAAAIGLFAAALASHGAAGQAPAASTPSGTIVDVTVHEGTSMAAALSPDRRTIAIDLQGTLWTLPIAGGAAKRITDEYDDARQPSWSPDGRRIAFQGYRDGTWRVWSVAADGSDLKAMTSGPYDDREPSWSPDGKTIAFSSDRSGNYDIWTLDVASGRVRQVTHDPANEFSPAWSPDGREIAFVSTRTGAAGVYAATPDGTERRLAAAAGNIGAPAWTPDGRQVVFATLPGPGGAGAEPQLHLGDRAIADGEDYFPFRAQWLSADEFLYTADGQIKRRSIAGNRATPIAFSATLRVMRPHYTRRRIDFDGTAAQPAKGIVRPVASPDGQQIAFAALGDIWTMKIGAAPTRVTDDEFLDTDPAWSPDGTKLAFASDRAGGLDIWIHDLKSGANRRLTTLPGADGAPAWSPDGHSIAFVSNVEYKQGEVYVVNADGGEPRRVLGRTFGAGYPSWSHDGRFLVVSTLKPYSSRFREGMNYYTVVPVDGGTPRLVVPAPDVPIGKRSADGPAVSPDGTQLAFVSNDRLQVMPITPTGDPAGPARQLTTELADSISWAGPNTILYMATDRLKLLDVRSGSTRDVPLALEWRRHVPSGTLVVHVGRLVDGRTATVRTNMDIVVDGHRIRSVAPHSDAAHVGRVIDAANLTAMPGLIEAHGHQFDDHGRLFDRANLAYGVTTVRSPGGNPYEGLEEREAVASGRRPGPRLFMTGYLLDGRRPYYPIATTAPDETVVDLELDRARRLGYDFIKTYVRLPDLLQKRAIEEAHRIGIPTSSHEIYPAALSGTDSVEHTGATSRRGYSPKQSALGRAYEDVIQIVAQSHMTLTPTVALGGYQAAVAGDPSILRDPRMVDLQPPWVRAPGGGRGRGGAAASGAPNPQALHAFAQRAAPELLALLHAGVPIVAGVDAPLVPYGAALHTELQAYVEAGFTPFQALQTATTHTAALLNAQDDLGAIEPGKLADIVLVDGNPLADIRDAMKVRTVIRDGEVWPIEALLKVPTGE